MCIIVAKGTPRQGFPEGDLVAALNMVKSTSGPKVITFSTTFGEVLGNRKAYFIITQYFNDVWGNIESYQRILESL